MIQVCPRQGCRKGRPEGVELRPSFESRMYSLIVLPSPMKSNLPARPSFAPRPRLAIVCMAKDGAPWAPFLSHLRIVDFHEHLVGARLELKHLA